jgi:serine protease
MPIPRVLDTRVTGGKLQNNEERVVATGVPAGALAAVINLTVTETEQGGFVAVFPADSTWPGNSSINWSSSGQNLANSVITATDATGHIRVRGGVNPAHVVIDTQGFFA